MTAPVLHVEDDEFLARSVARRLGPLVPVRIARTLGAARTELLSHSWLGLILDRGLPDGDGFELIELAKSQDPSLPILVLTGREDADTPRGACVAAALFLRKPPDDEALHAFVLHALHVRAAGANAKIRETLAAWILRYRLTSAEVEVLRLTAADGLCREEIAQRRDSSPATVKKQTENILRKTGDRSLLSAALRLLREAAS